MTLGSNYTSITILLAGFFMVIAGFYFENIPIVLGGTALFIGIIILEMFLGVKPKNNILQDGNM